MRLFLIRHAAAEERDAARWPDDSLRPLTAAGRAAFVDLLGVVGTRCAALDALLSSGFVRAWQTAALVHELGDAPDPVREPKLEPTHVTGTLDAPHAALDALSGLHGRVALVGHEPDLSALASLLVAGRTDPPAFRMRKGAVLALRLPGQITPGRATVDWMLHPAIVRA